MESKNGKAIYANSYIEIEKMGQPGPSDTSLNDSSQQHKTISLENISSKASSNDINKENITNVSSKEDSKKSLDIVESEASSKDKQQERIEHAPFSEDSSIDPTIVESEEFSNETKQESNADISNISSQIDSDFGTTIKNKARPYDMDNENITRVYPMKHLGNVDSKYSFEIVNHNKYENVASTEDSMNGLESEITTNDLNNELIANLTEDSSNVSETIGNEATLNDRANIHFTVDSVNGLESNENRASAPFIEDLVNDMVTVGTKEPIDDMSQKNPSNSSAKEDLLNAFAALANIYKLTDSIIEDDESRNGHDNKEAQETNDEMKFAITDPEAKLDSHESEKSNSELTDFKSKQVSFNLERINSNHNFSNFPHNTSYKVKWIVWKSKLTPIITQNKNGPCPLIAICNVLLLRNEIVLPLHLIEIPAYQLLKHVEECLHRNIAELVTPDTKLIYEEHMQIAISNLPRFQFGIDVDIKFTGVHDFEYSEEHIIFDFLEIPLYHGWLVDPQAPEEIKAAIGNCSFNQIMDKIITNISSFEIDLVNEALLAESFLNETASQLTYHGLDELFRNMEMEEVGILFRNNHFITLFKYENKLYQLLTDEGFLNELNIAWETLDNIDGAGEFVDDKFRSSLSGRSKSVRSRPHNVRPSNQIAGPSTQIAGQSRQNEEQVDQDYLMALSLQEEEDRNETLINKYTKPNVPN